MKIAEIEFVKIYAKGDIHVAKNILEKCELHNFSISISGCDYIENSTGYVITCIANKIFELKSKNKIFGLINELMKKTKIDSCFLETKNHMVKIEK